MIARRNAGNERKESLRAKENENAESQAHPSQSSILDRSVILGNGINWTFVPKGALLVAPTFHQGSVNLTKGEGRYLPFSQFVSKNRGWVSTHSVTLEQARGKEPISEEVKEALLDSGRVVVTVCQGGPISTRQPRVAAVAANETTK